jgi:ATP-dependent RNA helicase RhlE
MPFSKLGLTDQLVRGILATGYTAPTAIQSKAIPLALAGRDIIGCAQTGTGKTAAFVLPMLNRFSKHASHIKDRHVRGLVLTPTRELAQQVDDFIGAYGRFTDLQSTAIFGGVNMENQIKRLRRGVDIVAATPGRLLDHLQRRTIDLSKVEFLVIDEADRLFDMGFINDVKSIISKTSAKRQTLLFSATISNEVKGLVAAIQEHPELIEIGIQQQPVETVTQNCYSVPQEVKMGLLLHLIEKQEMDSVLIFSRTKHGADRICHRLQRKGIEAVAIHSDRTQAQRQRALSDFKNGRHNILVATDIAARGIDVQDISHVINYDTPTFAEDYIHRIGRTGRAASTGDAITFVSGDEMKYLRRIEKYIGRKFEVNRYEGYDYNQEPSPDHAPRSEKHGKFVHADKKSHRDRFDRRKGRPQAGGTSQGDNRKDRRRSHQHAEQPRQGDLHRRSNEEKNKRHFDKTKPDQRAQASVQAEDWRKLIEGSSEEKTFPKKQKGFFRRKHR